jgi:hypothetical protein
MNPEKTLAWIVLIAVIAIVYIPMSIRIYKRWKQHQANKRQPLAPLLGVVYPNTNDDKDK